MVTEAQVYEVLSYQEWKIGSEVRDELYKTGALRRGVMGRIPGGGHKLPTVYGLLSRLVEQDFAEMRIREQTTPLMRKHNIRLQEYRKNPGKIREEKEVEMPLSALERRLAF